MNEKRFTREYQLLKFYSFENFSHKRWLMVFRGSLSDSQSLQVSRTLLSFLLDLNNAVASMISTYSIIFNSSSPCTNLLVTVLSAPITFGITITFIFRSFFIL